MKSALSVLLLTAASRLAQAQQALPRWRENRGQDAVEVATILFPVAVQASEQSEWTRTARSRIVDTKTLFDSRSRGSPPGTRSRGSTGQAAVVDHRSRGSPPGTRSRGSTGQAAVVDPRSRDSPPFTRSRGSNGQAAVDNARTSTAPRSRAVDYGVYSFEAGESKGRGSYDGYYYESGKGKGKGGYDASFYALGKGKGKGNGKGKGKGGSSKHAKSKGE
jgi:hypothetical protein